MKNAVETHELTRCFGTFTAVGGVNLAIPAGSVVGLLGPNGAGKTTLLRLLLGVLSPSSGHALVLGRDTVSESGAIRRSTGYMSQRFSLYNDLSVDENLRFYGRIYGLRGPHLRDRKEELLEWSGLHEYRRSLAGGLGGGLRQRLAFACAILHRPTLLMLDEPTSGVDPASRRRFWDLIYGLSDDGATVLVTTHYMDEAEQCGTLGIMAGGRLAALGSPDELRRRYGAGNLEEVFRAASAG